MLCTYFPKNVALCIQLADMSDVASRVSILPEKYAALKSASQAYIGLVTESALMRATARRRVVAEK